MRFVGLSRQVLLDGLLSFCGFVPQMFKTPRITNLSLI